MEQRKSFKDIMMKEKLVKDKDKCEAENEQLRQEVSDLLRFKKKTNINIWKKKREKQRDNVMTELKQLQHMRAPPISHPFRFSNILFVFICVSFFCTIIRKKSSKGKQITYWTKGNRR